MKKCSCCGELKDDSEFQGRKASKDGLTASCKQCLKLRDQGRYPKEKEYRASMHKEYMQTRAGKQSHANSVAQWQERNRVRRAANVILGNALRGGSVKKLPCFLCGVHDVQGHHPDYSRPLDVVWLCVAHHRELHLTYQG